MDRLQSMRVFREVVDEGGFAAAARKLDLAPAVVTRLVSDLEKHLGVRLLQRTTRRLSLTPAGEGYLNRLRVILSDIDEADALAHSHSREMSGTVRLLAPPVLATHFLAPAIPGFQHQYPLVQLDVHVADLADPNVEDYDLSLLSGHTAVHREAVVRTILSSQSIFCAAPSYLAEFGEPRLPQDLLQHRCLRLRVPGVRLRAMDLLDTNDNDRQLALEIPAVTTANHTDTLLQATIAGGGISSLPSDLVAPMLRSGQLRRVLAPWITSRLTLVAAYPSRRYMPARTRAFLDHLVEHAQKLTAGLGLED
jgi:DNA-binding transcriptional LysR family regulator